LAELESLAKCFHNFDLAEASSLEHLEEWDKPEMMVERLSMFLFFLKETIQIMIHLQLSQN
jgi:hypothetical protein